MLKNAIYSFVLCAIAGASFLAGSLHDSRHPVTAAAADHRTPLYYRCPMHPNYTSDKPGIARCCGMALEPVYDGPVPALAAGSSHASADTIVVSPQQQQLIGVKVGTFEKVSGVERVRLFGRVVADESRIRKLTVGVNGYVRDVFEATTSSYVRKGQVLATFATIELRQPINAYISALDVLDRERKSGVTTPGQTNATQTSVDLTVERLLTLGVSPVQLETIRSTRVVPSEIQVISPIDGFVVARGVFAGQKFEAGMELFQIADLQRVWILADLPAEDTSRVTPGMDVTVNVGGRTTKARVSSKVPPQFDSSTQSFKLRVEADNTGFVLRPDMFVDVHLEIPYDGLALPSEAVVRSGLRNTVFVERAAGVFEPREVEIGRRLGDRIEIARGLSSGERIIVSGTFLLDSETRMKRHDQPHH